MYLFLSTWPISLSIRKYEITKIFTFTSNLYWTIKPNIDNELSNDSAYIGHGVGWLQLF